MDPLSITSASVGLAAAVYKCAIEVKKIVGTIADAADSLSDLAEEVQLIQGALQGVEDALKDNQEAISRYKVEEVFSIAVKGCRATLTCIKQEFELLFNRSDWKARFMVLWKEDDMKKLLGRLDRKRESIQLLLQLLSLSSVREVQALVAKKQSALTVAKEDITALIPTYWSCRDTILDSLDKETVESIYADWENRESKLSTTEFDFDYELINTRTYRRALTQAQAKRSRELPPGRKLDTPAQEPNDGIVEPVEDLIDLSCEPSQQTPSVLPHIPPQSYEDLAGLQFMPITADEDAASGGSLDTSQATEPIDMREMTYHLREPDLSPEFGKLSLQDRMSSVSRRHELMTEDPLTEIRQDEARQEEVLTGQPPDGISVTLNTLRNKATKSQTSLLIEYFEGGGASGRIALRVKPRMRKGVNTKHHPEVTRSTRVGLISDIPSNELLQSSSIGNSNPPNIGDSSLQGGPADLETNRGQRRRASPRRSSPRQAAEILDNSWEGRLIPARNPNDLRYQPYDLGYIPDDDMKPRSRNIARRSRPRVNQSPRRAAEILDDAWEERLVPFRNLNDSRYQPYDSGYIPDYDMKPRSRNIARRSRPKVKQSERIQNTDSTEANEGLPPNMYDPRLLETVEELYKGRYYPSSMH